jgi:hypothetical protein
LVKVAPLLDMTPDWRAFLNSVMPEEQLRDIGYSSPRSAAESRKQNRIKPCVHVLH